MKQSFLSMKKVKDEGLAVIRLVTGLLLVYHGWEIFDFEKMKPYFDWEQFKFASWLVYAGKISELIGGFLFALGLFTRFSSIVIAGTMLYISLFVGNGKIWYEDQHPFLFVLLALVFFFTGGGKYSIDHFLFNKNNLQY